MFLVHQTISEEQMNKYALLIKKVLKVGDISLETVKYYGFDYPKVFNRFRCSSISDTSTYSGNTIKYKSGDALEDNIDNEMFKLLTCRSKLTIITCWFKINPSLLDLIASRPHFSIFGHLLDIWLTFLTSSSMLSHDMTR